MNQKTLNASDDLLKNEHIFNLPMGEIMIFTSDKSTEKGTLPQQSLNIPLYTSNGLVYLWSMYGTMKTNVLMDYYLE
jgi:hypothetical protein